MTIEKFIFFIISILGLTAGFTLNLPIARAKGTPQPDIKETWQKVSTTQLFSTPVTIYFLVNDPHQFEISTNKIKEKNAGSMNLATECKSLQKLYSRLPGTQFKLNPTPDVACGYEQLRGKNTHITWLYANHGAAEYANFTAPNSEKEKYIGSASRLISGLRSRR